MLKNFLPKSDYFKNLATLITGTAISQVVPLLVSPIITRLYTEDEYGILALYGSVVAIVSIIANGKYNAAILLPKNDSHGFNILVLGLVLTAIVSAVSSIAAIFFNHQLAALLNSESFSVWVPLVPLSIFLVSSYQCVSYWANRKGQYKYMAVGSTIKSTFEAGIKIVFGAFGSGAFGLILSRLVGEFFSVGFLSIKNWKDTSVFKRYVSLDKIRVLAKDYKDFPLYSSSSAFINTFSLQVPVLLLTFFFSESIVGLFALCSRVLNMPMTVVGNAFRQIFYKDAVQSFHVGQVELFQTFVKSFKLLLLIGLVPLLIILAWGPQLFGIVFGAKWEMAGVYAQWLMPWIYVTFIISPLSSILNIKGKLKYNLFIQIVLLAIRVVSLLIGGLRGNELLAIQIFGVSGFLFNSFQLIWFFNLARPKKTNHKMN